MSKAVTVTGKELYELKWFCKNVAGVRTDMYKMLDVEKQLQAFDEKITRLERSAANIERWIAKIEEPAKRNEP